MTISRWHAQLLSGGCRIVICGLTGQYLDQIGGNGAALKDGTFDSAAFNRPQGLAFSSKRGRLYVADTENHALREVGTAPAASASPMTLGAFWRFVQQSLMAFPAPVYFILAFLCGMVGWRHQCCTSSHHPRLLQKGYLPAVNM